MAHLAIISLGTRVLRIDGSRHDWLEGRGPYLTPLGGIDDPTNRKSDWTIGSDYHPPLDPGIRNAVEAMARAAIETFSDGAQPHPP